MFRDGLFSILISTALLAPLTARAAIQIPKNLTQDDRQEALRVIGLGTGEKLLSDPYPLGGYDGFEVGFALEDLPTDSLAKLGSKLSSPQEDVTFPKLTIGKGVYNNLDFFIEFTPYRRSDELTQFGGLIRWGFYQGQLFPFSTALLLYANSANTSNLIATRTYGTDLMIGVSVGQVSIFGGAGYIQSNGTFTGGTQGITLETTAQDETVNSLHTFIGANLRVFDKMFLAAQIDRTEISVVSGKLGARF